MTLSEDELAQLRAKVDELEAQIAAMRATDEVRETEMRSLELEVALKAEYIKRLERIEVEVVAPKDVHIRNLEAIIADLQGPASVDAQGPTGKTPSISRIAGLRRRKG